MKDYRQLFEEQYKKEIDRYKKNKKRNKWIKILRNFLISLCIVITSISFWLSLQEGKILDSNTVFTKIMDDFGLFFSIIIIVPLIITVLITLWSKKSKYRLHPLEKYATEFAETVYADDIVSIISKVSETPLSTTFEKNLKKTIKQYHWYHKGFDIESFDCGKSLKNEILFIDGKKCYLTRVDTNSLRFLNIDTNKGFMLKIE